MDIAKEQKWVSVLSVLELLCLCLEMDYSWCVVCGVYCVVRKVLVRTVCVAYCVV